MGVCTLGNLFSLSTGDKAPYIEDFLSWKNIPTSILCLDQGAINYLKELILGNKYSSNSIMSFISLPCFLSKS